MNKTNTETIAAILLDVRCSARPEKHEWDSIEITANALHQILIAHLGGHLPVANAASDSDPVCSAHPDAPHGFDRNASHNAGRYTCECEGWVAPPANTCRQCKGAMLPGQAMAQTFSAGMPDFGGDQRGTTMSPGGPGKLIACLKCVNCGWSVLAGGNSNE